MSNLTQRYCNYCAENRRCTTDAAGQGEIALWFIAGLLFCTSFGLLFWAILLWRVIGGKSRCDTCGSTDTQHPK